MGRIRNENRSSPQEKGVQTDLQKSKNPLDLQHFQQSAGSNMHRNVSVCSKAQRSNGYLSLSQEKAGGRMWSFLSYEVKCVARKSDEPQNWLCGCFRQWRRCSAVRLFAFLLCRKSHVLAGQITFNDSFAFAEQKRIFPVLMPASSFLWGTGSMSG